MFYKETEYALRGLVYIQLQNYRQRIPGISEISSEIGAPRPYIAKILQRLVKQGLVNSQKGKNGGFYFEPSKPELYLREVVAFTEGEHLFHGCGLGLKECSNDSPCPLHEQLIPIRESVRQLLNNETIQNLARKLHTGEEIQIGRHED